MVAYGDMMNIKLKGLSEDQLKSVQIFGGAITCGSQGTGGCKIENGTECDGGLIYDLRGNMTKVTPLHVII